MRDFTEDEIASLTSRLKLDPLTGCLNWTGCTQKPGKRNQLPYAVVRCRKNQLHGHRLAMMMKLNGPIPNGLHVLHNCHNATCCNIDHLRLGTPKDNANDKMLAGRARNGGRKSGSHISDQEVQQMAATGLSVWQLAKKFRRYGPSIRAAFIRCGVPLPPNAAVSRRRTGDAVILAVAASGHKTMAAMAEALGMSKSGFHRASIRLGLHRPKTQPGPMDADEAHRLAALNLRSLNAIAVFSGRDAGTIRRGFERAGIPLPAAMGRPRSSESDTYWHNIAALGLPSVNQIARRFHHGHEVINREFKARGIPVPVSKRGRKPNKPTTPTNNKGA